MKKNNTRIRIAVQKSGRLTEHTMELLTRCGLIYSKGRDQLICYGENMPVDVILVRDDDISSLVQENLCDLGIVGLNEVEETRLKLVELDTKEIFSQISSLDFGYCRLSFAIPEDQNYTGLSFLNGKRIATSYPQIVGHYLKNQGIKAEVIEFSGAVEITPGLGKADMICDLVSSGSTLQANELREADTILESRATLIQTPVLIPTGKQEWLQRLLQRIQGVLQVKESKYIMLHAPRSALPEISKLLPGSESPTIIPLEGRNDKVAVHAVCKEKIFWETLELLKEAGASSVLVLPVEKMLA